MAVKDVIEVSGRVGGGYEWFKAVYIFLQLIIILCYNNNKGLNQINEYNSFNIIRRVYNINMFHIYMI